MYINVSVKCWDEFCSMHSSYSAAGAIVRSFDQLFSGHLMHVLAHRPWHRLQADVGLTSSCTPVVIPSVLSVDDCLQY